MKGELPDRKQYFKLFLIFFIIGIGISCAVSNHIRQRNNLLVYKALDVAATRVVDNVIERIHLYQYGLRGVRGVINTLGVAEMTHDRFRLYSMTRDIASEFPGAKGFGFIQRVPEKELTSFIAEKRKTDNQENFNIRKLGQHSGEHFIIKYTEPFEVNSRALGLDVASETNRRTAAELSAQLAGPVLTAPITLVQTTSHQSQSFLIMLPVFKDAVVPPEISMRMQSIIGWSYAALDMNDVMNKLVLDKEKLTLTLTDISPKKNTLFFSIKEGDISELSEFKKTLNIDIYGRSWQVEVGAKNNFISDLNLFDYRLVLFLGVLCSFFSGILTSALLISLQQRKKINEFNSKLASIIESSIDAIVSVDKNSVITSWNKGAERIFGYLAKDAIGETDEILSLESLDAKWNGKKYNNDEYYCFDGVAHRKNGSYIDVSVGISPIYNESHAIIGISHTIRDISKQKKAENKVLELNTNLENQIVERTKELVLAKRNLQTVLDAVPSLIGYWDKNLINRVANKKYTEWFGINNLQIPGMQMKDLLGDKLFEQAKPYVNAVLNGTAQIFERAMPTDEGIRYAYTYYLPDIDQAGDVIGFYVIIHDITEITINKQKLAAALRENEALLSTINQQMLYTATDIKGIIIDVNDNFCLVSGYNRDEIIGQSHKIVNSGVHASSFWVDLWQQISTGKPWRNEICDKTKNGDLKWFDTVISPFFNDNGEIERYVCLRSDITQRKQIEKEKNRITHLFETVLRSASEIAIIATDTSGIITLFNAGAEHMLGYSAGELIGIHSPNIIHLPEEVAYRSSVLSEKYNQDISGFRTFVYIAEIEGAETHIWTYVRKNGSKLKVSLTVTAMRDADNTIIGYLGIALDISSDLINRQELINAKDQLTIASDIADLGIWSWDLDKDVLTWNKRMFEIYGYMPLYENKQDISYLHWANRIHPDDINDASEQLRLMIEEDKPYETQFRVVMPDGAIKYVHAKGKTEKDIQNKIIKVTGINRDISNQRELENWLIKAKEHADSASAAKSNFLANMSHEIRTPMNAVLGMLQLVLKTELNRRQYDYLNKAYISANSLLGLLNDILDFSKMDSGNLKLNIESVDLNDLMSDLGVILSGNQGGKDVEIIFDLDPALPAVVMGDYLRIKQILINVAGNAIKFTEQGQVIVRLSLLEKNNNRVRILFEIIDTGIGISSEHQSMLFSAFSQAEASISRRFGGTGLGLVISKKLANLMGGDLLLESKLGEGSRFWFEIEFPCADSSYLSKESESSDVTGLRILVVDDNEDTRDIFSRFIESSGGFVDTADAGEKAIKMVDDAMKQGEPYDAIVMDYRMSGIDGLRTAELIQSKNRSDKPIAIIMVTAFGRDELTQRQDRIDVPYVDILVKPLTQKQLIHSLFHAVSATHLHPLASKPLFEQQKRLEGLYLLVVEDNALNREIAYELLSAEGALVDLAEGGIDGVTKVFEAKQSYDAVIMDIQMPDIDGLEATRRIRANSCFVDLPIMAMTANASDDDRQICLRAGMTDHIGKPIDIDEVVARLLKLIKHKEEAPSLLITQKDPTEETLLVESFERLLKRFSGKKELFLRASDSFKTEAYSLLNHCIDAHEQNDKKELLMSLHSLKGISGTMGAVSLTQLVAELEKLVKETEIEPCIQLITDKNFSDIEQLIDHSLAVLARYADEISDSITKKSQSAPSLAIQDFSAELKEFRLLLESGNLDVLDKAEKWRSSLSENEILPFVDLLEQINSLNFNNAINIINRLLGAQ